MGKGRLEAFSDGVIAIIITIMVLELKVPHSEDGPRTGDADAADPGLHQLRAQLRATWPSTGTTITTCCTRPRS